LTRQRRASPATSTSPRRTARASINRTLEQQSTRRPWKTRQAGERRPAFRRTVKWRTGSAARIATLNASTAGTAPQLQLQLHIVVVNDRYTGTYRDAHGAWLDAARSYRLHLPGPVPANNFWPVVVHDL